MNFSRPLSCAPLQYHLFAGLLVMAAALGNRVFVPLGAQRVCPHLWVALFGAIPPSSGGGGGDGSPDTGQACRAAPYKGTCLCRADQAGLESRQKSGEAAFPSRLGTSSSGLIWGKPRKAGFRWRSLSGFKGYLTETFDGRTDYQWEGFTQKVHPEGDEEKTLVASSPALSILAGGSIEGLSQKIREEEMAGLLPPDFCRDSSRPAPGRAAWSFRQSRIENLRSGWPSA